MTAAHVPRRDKHAAGRANGSRSGNFDHGFAIREQERELVTSVLWMPAASANPDLDHPIRGEALVGGERCQRLLSREAVGKCGNCSDGEPGGDSAESRLRVGEPTAVRPGWRSSGCGA